MRLSVAIARALCAHVKRHGLEPDALLALAGVRADLLADPIALVSADDFQRVVAAAYVVTGDPALGLRVGAEAPMGMLHVVGHLLASAETLRDAFGWFRRFLPLIAPEDRYELLDGEHEALFRFEPAAIDPQVRRFQVEATLTYTIRVANTLLVDPNPPTEVTFAYARPAHADVYAAVLGCAVRFDADHHAIRFPRFALDSALPLADRGLGDALRGRAEHLLAVRAAERDAEVALPARVMGILRRSPRLDEIALDDVARELRTTPRTLRRHLAHHGRGFAALLDDVRRERACTELAVPSTMVKQLAEQLGFSEPTALHRAFKRWTGQTIGAFRRRAQLAP
ncbi:MAG: AraC family transcriptional regulator [Deltaproteobacteria bacterium]|nr:AraC family transcriptional regulator [Deltaproteobacteria bacterium]